MKKQVEEVKKNDVEKVEKSTKKPRNTSKKVVEKKNDKIIEEKEEIPLPENKSEELKLQIQKYIDEKIEELNYSTSIKKINENIEQINKDAEQAKYESNRAMEEYEEIINTKIDDIQSVKDAIIEKRIKVMLEESLKEEKGKINRLIDNATTELKELITDLKNSQKNFDDDTQARIDELVKKTEKKLTILIEDANEETANQISRDRTDILHILEEYMDNRFREIQSQNDERLQEYEKIIMQKMQQNYQNLISKRENEILKNRKMETFEKTNTKTGKFGFANKFIGRKTEIFEDENEFIPKKVGKKEDLGIKYANENIIKQEVAENIEFPKINKTTKKRQRMFIPVEEEYNEAISNKLEKKRINKAKQRTVLVDEAEFLNNNNRKNIDEKPETGTSIDWDKILGTDETSF